MRLKFIRPLCTALAMLLPVTSWAADTVILSADHWCPHTCDPASGRSGYMIDVAREAFALAGIKTVYQIKPWATSLEEIRSGLADGLVGTLATEVPDLPHNHLALGRQANAFVVRIDDALLFTGLDSLIGRRIGTVRNYSYSTTIDAWLAGHAAQVVPQPGNHAAAANLGKLLDGQVDVVVDDEAVLRDAVILAGKTAKIRVAGRLSGGNLHVAFSPLRQRDLDLAAILDDGIDKLRRNGRLGDILASYGLADWEMGQ